MRLILLLLFLIVSCSNKNDQISGSNDFNNKKASVKISGEISNKVIINN